MADPAAPVNETDLDRATAISIALAEALAQQQAALIESDVRVNTASAIGQARLAADLDAASVGTESTIALAQARIEADQETSYAESVSAGALAGYRVAAFGAETLARLAALQVTTAATTAAARRNTDARLAASARQTQSGIDAATVVSFARVAATQVRTSAQILAARAESQAGILATQETTTASVVAAQSESSARVAASALRASTARQVDDLEALTRVSVANTDADATSRATTIETTADRQVSDIGLSARSYSVRSNEAAEDYADGVRYASRVAVSGVESVASFYAADRDLAGVQFRESRELARLNLKIAYADGKFELLFPLVSVPPPRPGFTVATPGFVEDFPGFTRSGIQPAPFVSSETPRALARLATESALSRGYSARRGYASTGVLFSALSAYYGQNQARSDVLIDGDATVQVAPPDAELTLSRQVAELDAFSAQQQSIVSAEANAVRRQVGLFGATARMLSVR